MADRDKWKTRSKADGNRPEMCITEGWVHHYSAFSKASKQWMKRWLLLDGSHLLIFASDRATTDNMVDSLALGRGTQMRDISFQQNVLGLHIELKTMTSSNEQRTDFFQFSTPNQCDLWKAYIFGFSHGAVPDLVKSNLLPGQLKDVHEAVTAIGPAPPPLPRPNNKRPSLKNILQDMIQPPNPSPNISSPQMITSPISSQMSSLTSPQMSSPISPQMSSQVSSQMSSQMSSQIPSPRPKSEDIQRFNNNGLAEANVGNAEPEQVLGQLKQRQADLAFKALDKEIKRPSVKSYRGGFADQRWPPTNHESAVETWTSFQFNQSPSFLINQQQQQLPPWSSQSPAANSNQNQNPWFAHKKVRSPIINNNMLPPFYNDVERNQMIPPWFINCSRENAEMILKAACNHGNILMRPSFNMNTPGTFVISMRLDFPGRCELHHYAIVQTYHGFLLDVVDPHSPMFCLSDVMDFFVRYIGPTARPMNAADVDRLFPPTIIVASNRNDALSPQFFNRNDVFSPPFSGRNEIPSPSFSKSIVRVPSYENISSPTDEKSTNDVTSALLMTSATTSNVTTTTTMTTTTTISDNELVKDVKDLSLNSDNETSSSTVQLSSDQKESLEPEQQQHQQQQGETSESIRSGGAQEDACSTTSA